MKTKKIFNVSCNGIQLPFELYSIDYILDELDKNKELFGSVKKIENATKAKIKQFYGERNVTQDEHVRYFAYIKFFNYKGECYGIVGGKTNYIYPDLNFDMKKDEKDNRYARNFLHIKGINWDETIIIVNHRPSNSEEADKQEALFIECYLQRLFNLFAS